MSARRTDGGRVVEVEDRGRKVAVAGAFVVALGVGVLLVGLVRSGRAGTPSIGGGVLLESAGLGPQPILIGPDGERAILVEEGRWCIADLPPLAEFEAGESPVAIDSLPTAALDMRCTDSYAIASPHWSPDGTRIVAQAHESTGASPEFDLRRAELVVFDAVTLDAEAVLSSGRAAMAVWVGNSEVLYYPGHLYPDPIWHITSVEGETREVNAPSPLFGDPVRVDDSTVAYLTGPADGSAAPGIAEVGRLIALDPTTGTVTDLAPLQNLNLEGTAPDPGLLTGISSDLGYAVLFALVRPNESGRGPTAYGYDVEGRELIPHAPPELGAETRTSLPVLVGDSWVAYTAIPGDGSERIVYIAPIDDPSATVELFKGTLVAGHDNYLIAVTGFGELAVLELNF